ncbi:MAG: F0F1 ATP synthase subunit gamma [Gallionella sp.]|nr:F0F1 ATP synthase subunit gamma [Gallionella sp.]OIO12721.1 MAG: F0F1 ATP synthase subunit gamma [Gallionellaceae bacterium CG1_02_60_325]PIR10018.1 MAG: F0F1 ATP synthase subunit gamma [Gallionellaceae bacterium CG11_big_fil_rev_8_21_14_0_20_60_62]PJC05055.1 MAG: F0F1 ATP synthase subunit gamma [Gallionellaceae bacterium CG_4_9_14_0_8_um_filter_60_335]
MSETAASLRHQIASAGDLESVVRTMKAMAASNIGQYENAVRSLGDYDLTVQLGLAACLRQDQPPAPTPQSAQHKTGTVGAIVFGSDQGLVGQFNEVMVEFVVKTLASLPGKKTVWVIGERIQARLTETGLDLVGGFILPNSISAITPLVGEILIEMEKRREKGEITQVHLFHNQPKAGAIYMPVNQRLLPLDDVWRRNLATMHWPTGNLPEVRGEGAQTLRALVREYLFVSLFRACAESLASENASRLAAMQRAEKNIDELLEDLNRNFHRLRQSSIDEELFDVISGFEALALPQ